MSYTPCFINLRFSCPRQTVSFFCPHFFYLFLFLYLIFCVYLNPLLGGLLQLHNSVQFSGVCLLRSEEKNMNRCAIQQKSFASREEMRGGDCRSVSICVDKKETVICPKPRRVGLIHATRLTITTHNDPPVRPLRWHFSHQQEVCDSKAGNELLDIILAKGCYGSADQSVAPMASSPPFFSGSPPSRVSNPLIQDARFGDEKFTPVSPRAIPFPSELAPSPSSTRKGGCVWTNFGNNPAVRIEGFDCLDRDRRNCSIPALA